MQHQHNNKLPYASVYDFDYQQQRNQLSDMISEVTNSEDEDPLPTFEEFQGIISDYLHNLSPKKRDKALVDHARYCLIQEVLKNPRNTMISTAQFRFWVKKMFQLQPGSYDLVCHDNKPVAMKEQIYDILVNAHKEAHHGGRDKTSAIVRNQFSWIPKELVARFVRQCPTCISRRSGNQSTSAYTSKTSSPRVDYTPTVSGSYCYDPISMAAAAAAAATSVNISTPALLYTPSSKSESDMSTSPSTDATFRRSPNNYLARSPLIPKRPFFGQNGLFESEDPFEDTFPQRHMRMSADSKMNSAKYHIQEGTIDDNSASAQLRYPYRRPDFTHYSTYTDTQPSYYDTLVNSTCQDSKINVSDSHISSSIPYEPLRTQCQDNSTSISSPRKQIQHQPSLDLLDVDKNRLNILSHHGSSDSHL